MQILNLEKKIALVSGIADNVGFAWAIAKSLQAAGAEIILTCHPRVLNIVDNFLNKDKYKESRRLPCGEGELSPIALLPCDVAYENKNLIPTELLEQKHYTQGDVSIEGLVREIQKIRSQLDILVHSVAFSPQIDRSHLWVDHNGYLTAMRISSYSLISLTRQFLPLIENRQASIMAISYIASQRAIVQYGGAMASAKAALECDARMLAAELGPKGHRVNIISAGPYASRAARSVGDIEAMIESTKKKSPLQRSIDSQDVANTALFLSSDLSQNITGEVIHVDAGFHIM